MAAANREPGKRELPAPGNCSTPVGAGEEVGFDWVAPVVVASAEGVGTAIQVWSRVGVVA